MSLLDKSTPIPPRVIPGKYSRKFTSFVCRRCGHTLQEAWFRYCPSCGQAVLHASNSGVCGWKQEEADDKFDEITANQD
jgi:predicted amidophosphoribosyltransferase